MATYDYDFKKTEDNIDELTSEIKEMNQNQEDIVDFKNQFLLKLNDMMSEQMSPQQIQEYEALEADTLKETNTAEAMILEEIKEAQSKKLRLENELEEERENERRFQLERLENQENQNEEGAS
jgi:hypothetical protein